MIDYPGIGKRVKNIRRSARMTQKALSGKLNVSVSYISRMEKGNIVIGLDLINMLSSVFRCDINWLLWGDEAESDTHQFD